MTQQHSQPEIDKSDKIPFSLKFFRSTPLFVIPLLMPCNIDLLFFIYATFFYFYGVYLHSGHELPGLSAHNPYINTSFQGRFQLKSALAISLIINVIKNPDSIKSTLFGYGLCVGNC